MKALNNSQPVQRCNHVNAEGTICYRPATRGRSLCYVHRDVLQLTSHFFEADLELPVIETPGSVQIAAGQVLAALSAGDITRRRAALCLYALRLAGQSTKRLKSAGSGRIEKRAE
jgi:hypothetical protein